MEGWMRSNVLQEVVPVITQPVAIGAACFGASRFGIIAGPCAVESRERLMAIAHHVQRHGAAAVRGGVFKVRTDPRSFQGLGADALPYLDEVRRELGLPFIVEITAPDQVETLADHADAFQVGSRNMHNSYLLRELGRTRIPILLKRGFAAQLKEWLLAAEYVVAGGNHAVILCERGIRTFESETRNTLDLAGAVWARQHSPFPVLIDPSHATGRPELIGPMCLAAAAAGLDGILVEVHDSPADALSDGFQALTLDQFAQVTTQLGPVLRSVGRTL